MFLRHILIVASLPVKTIPSLIVVFSVTHHCAWSNDWQSKHVLAM